MKFKTGDIIKGIDNNIYLHTNTDMTRGIVTEVYENTKDGCDIEVKILEHTDPDEIGELYIVESKYFELIEHASFWKSDLKTGWRVFTRCDYEYVVIKDNAKTEGVLAALGREGGSLIECYKNDLTTAISGLDIVAVYEPTSEEYMLADFDEEHFKLVWKREEEPIEVTIKEIANWKGVSPERIRISED